LALLSTSQDTIGFHLGLGNVAKISGKCLRKILVHAFFVEIVVLPNIITSHKIATLDFSIAILCIMACEQQHGTPLSRKVSAHRRVNEHELNLLEANAQLMTLKTRENMTRCYGVGLDMCAVVSFFMLDTPAVVETYVNPSCL
jgi:hypothetical protein